VTKYILALDQGTTSSRAILFNDAGLPVAIGQQEFRQIYPQPGWVEHDPEEIWQSEWQAIQSCVKTAGINVADIAAVGITNQRETTVVWNRHTGQAVYNAIVWQCRRTAGMCDRLREAGHTDMVRAKTGLVIDAYFSGTKVAWILDNVPGAREQAERGDLVFGTIDSWLINKLTHQKLHVTDYSNASRTMIYNIRDLEWDDELLGLLNIPRSMCPTSWTPQVSLVRSMRVGSAAPSRLRGSPVISKLPSLGRAVIRLVRRRIPMGPARFS